ncbi:SRPBCC family protein [Leptospira idonii]|uniref:ATPase n=1 Tax=Leptospira idonii TaxID=1193500 RepID=A0A4R9M2G2_9LEPT|nr:SRPBCC family protein [Leptospira idonii]TGN19907.1 ATPase [Leptospira idonii]
MMTNEKLIIKTPSDKELTWVRKFNAPREFVFDALTKPELIRRWLLGPDGWSMIVCDVDLKVGGAYRYVWSHAVKGEMGMGGVFQNIQKPEKLVHTEVFDQSWYPGEAVITSDLIDKEEKTELVVTMLFASKEARDVVIQSNMESGLIASYDRLADILSSV